MYSMLLVMITSFCKAIVNFIKYFKFNKNASKPKIKIKCLFDDYIPSQLKVQHTS